MHPNVCTCVFLWSYMAVIWCLHVSVKSIWRPIYHCRFHNGLWYALWMWPFDGHALIWTQQMARLPDWTVYAALHHRNGDSKEAHWTWGGIWDRDHICIGQTWYHNDWYVTIGLHGLKWRDLLLASVWTQQTFTVS